MVTLNLYPLIEANGNETTPEKQVDRICNKFSSIVLDSKIARIPRTSELIKNPSLSDDGPKIHRSHRKCDKKSFSSEKHTRISSISRLSGEVSPKSRRTLDFSSEPQKYSLPTHGQNQGRSKSLDLNFYSSDSKQSDDVKTVDEVNIFKCEICGVTSSSEYKMERHRKLHQTNLKVPRKTMFKCVKCRKTFNQFAKLIIHKYNHPKSLKSNDLCNLCKARFEDLSRHHLEVHINGSGAETDTEEVVI